MPRRIAGLLNADPTALPLGKSLEQHRIMMDWLVPGLPDPGNQSVPKLHPPVPIGPTRLGAPPLPASNVGPVLKWLAPIPDGRNINGTGNSQAIVLTLRHQLLHRHAAVPVGPPLPPPEVVLTFAQIKLPSSADLKPSFLFGSL